MEWITSNGRPALRMAVRRSKFLLRHNHLGIKALAYPEGVKGVQPPLNVISVCLHKNTVQALPLCTSLYPKFCTGKR